MTQLLGSYHWNYDITPSPDALVLALEAAIGQPTNVTNVYPCWGSEATWATNLNTILVAQQASAVGKRLYPMIDLKFYITNNGDGYTFGGIQGLNDAASGKWDSVLNACVLACKTNGFLTAFFSISYAHNFGYSCDNEGFDLTTNAAWIAAFEHWSQALRSSATVQGVKIYILFNPALGAGSMPVDQNTPDPSTFDILSLDVLNTYYGIGNIFDPNIRSGFWNNPNGWGLQQHINLAKTLGNKPVYFNKCGAGPSPIGVVTALANDSAFWDCIASTIVSMRTQGVPFWGMNLFDVNIASQNLTFSDGSQPACLDSVISYCQNGTFLSDVINLATGTSGPGGSVVSPYATVTQPSPLVVGQQTISGFCNASAIAVSIVWRVAGTTPQLTDPDVVKCVIHAMAGTFSGSVNVAPASTTGVMWISLNGGPFMQAWIAQPLATTPSVPAISVNQPSPLVSGQVTITGLVAPATSSVALCWRTAATQPGPNDADVVQAVVQSPSGEFYAVMTIDHPGTRSSMWYSVNNSVFKLAWTGVPSQ